LAFSDFYHNNGFTTVGNSKVVAWFAFVASDQVPTFSIVDWIIYYYNPFGFYLVWDSPWIFPGFSNAVAIFWSVVGRTTAVVIVLYGGITEENQ
jgi:hypothetical protein